MITINMIFQLVEIWSRLWAKTLFSRDKPGKNCFLTNTGVVVQAQCSTLGLSSLSHYRTLETRGIFGLGSYRRSSVVWGINPRFRWGRGLGAMSSVRDRFRYYVTYCTRLTKKDHSIPGHQEVPSTILQRKKNGDLSDETRHVKVFFLGILGLMDPAVDDTGSSSSSESWP